MPRTPLPLAGRPCLHLAVSDMKRSVDFYVNELGFFYDHGLPNMAWLMRPEMLLLLSPGTPVRHPNSYWGWTVSGPEPLVELHARFQQRQLIVSDAPQAEGADGHFFLYDPDGYPLLFSVDKLDSAPPMAPTT
jgi:catechol 2,3-dioxygenase-like lactoylglutathione lyase family enzyme